MEDFEAWINKKNERRRSRLARKNNEGGKTIKKARKRIRSKPKVGFSEEIRQQSYNRAEGKCENPLCEQPIRGLGGEHHCLPRSQYHKADRNDLWNCATICGQCHSRITSPVSEEDIRLRRYFERLAIIRRDCNESEILRQTKILERRLRTKVLSLLQNRQSFTNKSS